MVIGAKRQRMPFLNVRVVLFIIIAPSGCELLSCNHNLVTLLHAMYLPKRLLKKANQPQRPQRKTERKSFGIPNKYWLFHFGSSSVSRCLCGWNWFFSSLLRHIDFAPLGAF